MTVLARAAGKHRMTQAMGAFALVAQLGPILGPIVAGGLLTLSTWRWLFWVNIPLCLIGYLLAARVLPTEPPASRDGRFDWIGLLLATPGLTLFVYGLTRLGHTSALAWLLVGLALLTAAGAWSWHSGPLALVDVRLFTRPSFALANLLSAAGFCMYGGLILLPLWLEQLRHASLLTVGLILAPQGIGAALPVLAGRRFTDRISPRRRILAGFALISLGTLPFVTTTPTWLQVLGLLVRGIGTGTCTPAITATALTGIDPRRIPAASSTYNVVQRIGAPLGTAITTTLLTQQLAHHAPGRAYSATFWAILASAAVPALLTMLLPEQNA